MALQNVNNRFDNWHQIYKLIKGFKEIRKVDLRGLRSTINVSFYAGGATFGIIGVSGIGRKIYKYVKGDKNPDGTNNKIQSIIATICCVIIGIGLSSLGFSLKTGAVLGLGLALNLFHITKLFVKDTNTKERLDNIAGIAGAIINSLVGISFLWLTVL